MKPADSPPAPTQLVRVFAENGRAGNPVAVTLLSNPPAVGAAQRCAASLDERHLSTEARCMAWPTAAGLAVRCEQNGVVIRCCGHGLLATAWVWHRCHAAVPLLVNGGDQLLHCTVSDSRAWLQFPRPRVVAVPFPSVGAPFPGLRSGPGARPGPGVRASSTAAPAAHLVAAAESGSADGYRILEYAPSPPLDALDLAYDAIAVHDGRALILTQRSTDPRYDYLIRYAAPRYGNDEDAATGSGNVIAATYWSERLQRPRLTGLQTPALPSLLPDLRAGGVIHSRIEKDHVVIGGELILSDRL